MTNRGEDHVNPIDEAYDEDTRDVEELRRRIVLLREEIELSVYIQLGVPMGIFRGNRSKEDGADVPIVVAVPSSSSTVPQWPTTTRT